MNLWKGKLLLWAIVSGNAAVMCDISGADGAKVSVLKMLTMVLIKLFWKMFLRVQMLARNFHLTTMSRIDSHYGVQGFIISC